MFNNRELAISLWVGIFIIAALIISLSKRNSRNALVTLINAVTEYRITRMVCFIFVYTLVLTVILYKIGFRYPFMIKDILLWTFGTAIIISFKLHKAKENKNHFKDLIIKSIGLVILLECVVNLYAFSLTTELILQPILIFLFTISAVAALKEEHRITKNTLDIIIAIIGFTLFIIVIYKTIVNFEEISLLNSIYSMILPIILTIMFIPFAYCTALYIMYEEFFTRVKLNIRDEKLSKIFRRKTIKICHINISKLRKFQQKVIVSSINDEQDIYKSIETFNAN